MNAQGYQSAPLSDEMERRIRERLVLEREEAARLKRTTRSLRDYLEALTDGRIAALEWVLQEAEAAKETV